MKYAAEIGSGATIYISSSINVRSEVFTALTMKNAVFWDVASCIFCVNRLSLQPPTQAGFLVRGFFYPDVGGDTFLRNVGSTRRHVPEDGILQVS
jgi:hypothetical protein